MNVDIDYIMPDSISQKWKVESTKKISLTYSFIRLKEIKEEKKKKPTSDPFIIDTEKEFNTV